MNHRRPTMQERCRARSRYSGERVRWFITKHALKRMRQMGLERSEVVAVLDEPEVRYPDRYGHFIACAGRLAVCFISDTVVTVLWRGREFTREVF
jgi:Domain of unknown function (DUF4258)